MTEKNSTDETLLPSPHQRNWRDWQEAQQPFQSPDPRFEFRLSSPEDFPEIYALLNTVFNSQRTTAEYDWIYKRNPYGEARCRVVAEKNSGRIVHTCAHFPWPLNKGDQQSAAVHVGDTATLASAQRQGLLSMRLQFQRSHLWTSQQIEIGLPNAASREADRKYKPGIPITPTPFARKILNWQRFLATKGIPRTLANIAAPMIDTMIRPTHREPSDLRIEPIHRFDQQHQTLSLEYSHSDGFWCPHGAQWMNWRYIGHPSKKYVAHALYSNDELKAFSVVRLDSDSAMLMELVSSDAHFSKILLAKVEAVARDAGAIAIDTYASESWKQWPALKQQRYFMRPSDIYWVTDSIDCPEALLAKNWQLLPGDSDVF